MAEVVGLVLVAVLAGVEALSLFMLGRLIWRAARAEWKLRRARVPDPCSLFWTDENAPKEKTR
jgi:hypothetical protein